MNILSSLCLKYDRVVLVNKVVYEVPIRYVAAHNIRVPVTFINDSGYPVGSGMKVDAGFYLALTLELVDFLTPTWSACIVVVPRAVHLQLQQTSEMFMEVNIRNRKQATPFRNFDIDAVYRPSVGPELAAVIEDVESIRNTYPLTVGKFSEMVAKRPILFQEFKDRYYLMKYVTRHPEIYKRWLDENSCQ